MIARPALRSVVLVTLASSVLAGCGMEAKDETSKEHSQIQAASNHIGAIRIRNAFITTQPASTGAGSTGSGRTYLVVSLLNRGSAPDALTGVTTDLGSATLTAGPDASVASTGVVLPPHVLVQVSTPEINPDAATLEIAGTPPAVGTTELVSFTFANAGTTGKIEVPVVSPGGSLSPTQVIPTDTPTFSIPIE
ncbi:MAG TPA: hypothetical protein VHD81_13155 [Mycobacteriales bacterium]|nr:hypothetical protein [Mycobacteriales bacterium]